MFAVIVIDIVANRRLLIELSIDSVRVSTPHNSACSPLLAVLVECILAGSPSWDSCLVWRVPVPAIITSNLKEHYHE
jgi:hypothetical protein